MSRLFRLCSVFFFSIYSMHGLAYGPWQPGVPSPAVTLHPKPSTVTYKIYSFWDQAGDYRIRVVHQGLKPGNIRLRLIPGALMVEIRQTQNRQSPFWQTQQSSNMRQIISLPQGIDPRRFRVVETNAGVEVRIPGWRYR